MSIYALKELRKFLRDKPNKEASLVLNPSVCDEVLKNKANLKLIEHKFRTKINLISDSTLHIEDIKIS